MWWISLIVLAIIALFLVKYIQSQVKAKQAEQVNNGLNAPAAREALSGTGADNPDSGFENKGPSTAGGAIAGATPTAVAAGTVDAVSGAAGRAVEKAAAASGVASAAGALDVSAVPEEHKAALNTGHAFNDIREMIKILNLAEPDAGRLAISPEQLRALRNGDQSAITSEQELGDLAARLRRMVG